jgi:hypothetical protein
MFTNLKFQNELWTNRITGIASIEGLTVEFNADSLGDMRNEESIGCSAFEVGSVLTSLNIWH